VKTKRALDLFIESGYRLRGRDSFYVPPLRRDMKHLLDRGHHPFHKHATVEYFLAFQENQIVGRIAAIDNRAHNEFHEEKVAFFGFFDLALKAGPEVARALLERAEEWARQRGLVEMRGPCSFSTNEECGMLIDGFDIPPPVMTTWNPPHYPRFVEAAGYTKAKDLYSWFLDEASLGDRILRLADLVTEKFKRRGENVVSRHINMKKFDQDLELVRQIYNSAWEKNWGFIPMTREEIDYMAAEMKPVIVPELVRFVEIDGEPAAFSFALPDYNELLQYCEGKLGPRQLAILLMLKSKIRGVRMLTMGVVEKYRNRGLESLLIGGTIDYGLARGFVKADLSWILEDNHVTNRTMKAIGSRLYRTHRIYTKQL
jgi:GNAT superfamily N-acetyltransferase